MSTRMVPAHVPTILVTGAQTGGRLALIETLEAQGTEPPRHCHHWEDETVYVLEGVVALFCAGRWVHAPPGAVVVVPRGMEHSFAVLSTTARILTMFTPAGFEAWYRDVSGAAPWSDTLEQVVGTAARYGCEITGPHPGRPSVEPDR